MKKAYLIDFDGTITIQDTLQYLLDKYGMKNWREIDHKVEKGLLSEREALTLEMQSLKIKLSDVLEELLEVIQIRDGFQNFYEYCKKNNHFIGVVSAGFQQIIAPILQKHGFTLSIYANHLIMDDRNYGWQYTNTIPFLPHCQHSICKCFPMYELLEKKYQVIFIGDGLTDFCIAKQCEYVYALKGSVLEVMLREISKKYLSFSTFNDILNNEL